MGVTPPWKREALVRMVQTDPHTCWESLVSGLFFDLGIYLAFMSIFIHNTLSGLSSNHRR